MKKKFLLLLSSLLLSSCSLLIPNSSSEYFDPWDKLGGGGSVSVGSSSNVDINDYEALENVNDYYKNEEVEGTFINLNDLSSLPSGVTVVSNTLTINKSGSYVLKGTFNGHIIVDKASEQDVKLVLDNVNITGINGSAPITFKKTTAKRVITLKEGSVNTIKDSSLNVGDTKDESIIEIKTCPLSINGKGKLILESIGSNTTPIKGNESLYIFNANLEIKGNNNGIKIDKKIIIEKANINITAKNDGIKTDIVPISLENASSLASSLENGYISIKNSNIDIVSGDDGIIAHSFLYINNDKEKVEIKTNNGAPNTISEKTSSSSNGKALKVEGISYVTSSKETKVESTHEDNYSLILNGGEYDLNSNSDAISSQGNVLIENGEFTISSGDDGIHGEYLTTIRNGDINIEKSYEGIEGSGVEIYGGNIIVNSIDDGINGANSDVINYDFHIYIGGGNIYVNSSGDGVDSNGWIEISDGKLIIDGPTSGMNGSLDSERGILVSKGDLLALGSRGMVETPASNSTQCYININLSSTSKENIKVYDSEDNELLNHTPIKEYQSVVLSLKSFEKGKTYYVHIGETVYEATLNNVGTALGTNSSGYENQGFMPGGRPPRR